ncbi:hypothetical protein AAVH_35122, partial [Aphelenchoides avenae]
VQEGLRPPREADQEQAVHSRRALPPVDKLRRGAWRTARAGRRRGPHGNRRVFLPGRHRCFHFCGDRYAVRFVQIGIEAATCTVRQESSERESGV